MQAFITSGRLHILEAQKFLCQIFHYIPCSLCRSVFVHILRMWRKGINSSLHAENQASPVPTHAQERPGKAQECSQEVKGHQHRDKDEPRRERALLRWEEGLLFRHSYTASYPTVAYRDLAQAMHHKITMIIISLLGPCRRGETDYSTVSQPLTV